MAYSQKTPGEQEQLRTFVYDALDRYSSYRDNKESMAYVGLTLFTGAVATALASKDWPPAFAANRPWLIILAFTLLWFFVILYLRYQLRRRRWAALRVAGCEWLLAEWLPDSPNAMAKGGVAPSRETQRVSLLVKIVDHILPLSHSVAVIKPEVPPVYPAEIEDAWLRAEAGKGRGTDALIHEWLIHLAGWVAYAAVVIAALGLVPHKIASDDRQVPTPVRGATELFEAGEPLSAFVSASSAEPRDELISAVCRARELLRESSSSSAIVVARHDTRALLPKSVRQFGSNAGLAQQRGDTVSRLLKDDGLCQAATAPPVQHVVVLLGGPRNTQLSVYPTDDELATALSRDRRVEVYGLRAGQRPSPSARPK